MNGLILWKKQELDKLKKDIDRMFSRMFDEFSVPFSARWDEVSFTDLSESEDELILNADIQGIRPEDINITVKDDILRIEGQVRQELVEGEGDYYRSERRYGSFFREIRLPCRIETDLVKASYKEGRLRIVLPKCKTKKEQQIRIRVK